MRHQPHRATDQELVPLALGALTAIAAAGALVAVRGTLDNTNIALILVVVVVAAAPSAPTPLVGRCRNSHRCRRRGGST